ncbi:MAG TPA: hypothetical protein VIG08_03240 [Gemmatimonadales bacterium]|jgi:hypothetical protein
MRNSSIACVAVLVACAPAAAPPARPAPIGDIAAAESAYADLRELRDRYDVTGAAGLIRTSDSVPLDVLARRHDELRASVVARLAAVDSSRLVPDDARALATMRATLARDIGPLGTGGGQSASSAETRPDCGYDPAAITELNSLRARLYACYGWAQHHVVAGSDTLDRLTVLGRMGQTADSAERRRLFLALEPVWRSVDGDGGPGSPYRRLIDLEVRPRGAGETSAERQARASGVPPDSLERWLTRILETWRDATHDSLVEPWDWFHAAGQASRALGSRIPASRLTRLNAEVFAALGADPAALGVRFDLAPREGKTPVAYTTFGRRARLENGRWSPAEPWVFATYREGGLDNLAELLHETGHAIHIAAIHTRPAFADWPNSDPFSEALGDFVALDVAEPAWQQRWLGDSVPLAEGLRGRYATIVMDVAWALFETRLLRDPALDPNEIWAGLTRDYLHIRPHREVSWWAMRGQLIDEPGYMMNYAAGAILIAAIRARTVEQHGAFATGDSTWYGWVASRLFRFGLERPTREVVHDFLGGPVTPAAILIDMRRMRRPSQ